LLLTRFEPVSPGMIMIGVFPDGGAGAVGVGVGA